MPRVKPPAFSAYTTPAFWDDEHVSAQMLAYHLDPTTPAASRMPEFLDRSVKWIRQVVPLEPGSRVLDLGCGPGLYASRLARAGVTVRGLDASRRSVAYAAEVARRADLPATFDVGDYLVDDLGVGYDATLLIYEDFCTLSPAQRAGLLERVCAALRPGGAFIMDVTAVARFAREHPYREQAANLDGGFWAAPPYEGVHERFTYDDERLVLDRYTITKDGVTRAFWNWMHCLTPHQVSAELSAAGFAAPDLWGDVAGAPFDPTAETFAVVARPQLSLTPED